MFNQYTSILYNFAIDGSEYARAALYQQYETMLKELSTRKRKTDGIYRRRDMFDWLCVWLTSLDGWNMFKRVVQDVCVFRNQIVKSPFVISIQTIKSHLLIKFCNLVAEVTTSRVNYDLDITFFIFIRLDKMITAP